MKNVLYIKKINQMMEQREMSEYVETVSLWLIKISITIMIEELFYRVVLMMRLFPKGRHREMRPMYSIMCQVKTATSAFQ